MSYTESHRIPEIQYPRMHKICTEAYTKPAPWRCHKLKRNGVLSIAASVSTLLEMSLHGLWVWYGTRAILLSTAKT